MKSKKLLIIELGERLIKISQINCQQQKKIVEVIESFEFSRDITSKDIDKALTKFLVAKYEKIIISLSRSFFLIRFLRIPSQTQEEIREMLPFQLAKIVPYSLEEITYDFSIAKVEEGFSKLTIFLIQEKRMRSILEFVKKHKVIPSTVTISSFGLSNWLSFQEKFLDRKITRPVIGIDIDKNYGEFLVSGQKGVMFSRAFEFSTDDSLLEGIRQSIGIFEREFGKIKFNKIIFTGNEKEVIYKKLNWQDAIFIPYWKNFIIDERMKVKVRSQTFSFASIFGLIWEEEPVKIDFSPLYIKKERTDLTKRKRYLEMTLIGLEIILIFSVFLFKYMYDKYSYLKFLDSELERIKGEVKQLDEAVYKLKILDKELKKSLSLPEMLYEVIRELPYNTHLVLLDFSERGEFTIKGYASDISPVFDIVTRLKHSEFFKQAKVKYASKSKQRGEDVVEFYIYGRINTNKDKE